MNIFSRIKLSYRNIINKMTDLNPHMLNDYLQTDIRNYIWDEVENIGLISRIFFAIFVYFLNLTLFYHFTSLYALGIICACSLIVGIIAFTKHKMITIASFVILLTSFLHVLINNNDFKQINHYTYADIQGTVSSIHIKKKISSFIISDVQISPYGYKHKKTPNTSKPTRYKRVSGKILAYTISSKIYKLKNGMQIHTVSAIKPYTSTYLPLKSTMIYKGWFQRIYGYSFITRPIDILPNPLNNRNSFFNSSIDKLKYGIKNIRIEIQNRVMALFPPKNNPVNAVMLALITGNKGFLTEDIYTKFREAGLSHLLAISGLHIGLVTMSIFMFVRFVLIMIPYSHLYVNNKIFSAIITLVFTTMYIIILEPAPPMIRSGIIIYIMLLSIIFRSISSSYYVLVIACYLMMIYDPTVVLNASFQLSFFATFVVLYISVNMYKPDIKNYKKILTSILMISFSSFMINLCIMPVSVYHFHSISMAGFITNPLVMLLMSFIIMPLILISLIFYKIFLMKYSLFLLSYAIKVVIWVTNLSINKHFVFQVDLFNGYIASQFVVSILFFLIIKSRIRYAGLIYIMILLMISPWFTTPTYNMGVMSNGGLFYVEKNHVIFISQHKSKRNISFLEQSLRKKVIFKRWDKSKKYLEMNINNHRIAYTRWKSQIKDLCKTNRFIIHYGSRSNNSYVKRYKNNSCKILNIIYNGSMVADVEDYNKINILFSQKLNKYSLKNTSISVTY